MNVVVICDKKPTECENCMFFNDALKEISHNQIEIVKKCFLGSENIEHCPLTEVNTVFADDPKTLGEMYDKTE
jgi:hypothetical protein